MFTVQSCLTCCYFIFDHAFQYVAFHRIIILVASVLETSKNRDIFLNSVCFFTVQNLLIISHVKCSFDYAEYKMWHENSVFFVCTVICDKKSMKTMKIMNHNLLQARLLGHYNIVKLVRVHRSNVILKYTLQCYIHIGFTNRIPILPQHYNTNFINQCLLLSLIVKRCIVSPNRAQYH